jgi:pilus assembly protein CpaC
MKSSQRDFSAPRRSGLAAAVLALAMAVGLAAPPSASAQAVAIGAQSHSGYEMVVGVGKSQVIELPRAYTDLMIADPKIADILPLNTHSIYVVGKAAGSTALTVYGPGKQLIAAVNVVVSADLEGFRNRLHEILPDEKNIEIRSANQSMVLYGTASSSTALNQVVSLAETYAPAKVVNMMTVQGTQQVMLSVRFVEMNRTTAKALRLNVDGSARPDPITGAPRFNFTTGDTIVTGKGAALDRFGLISALFKGADGDLTVLFDALETKGLVKTLAEPTLVAMSGDTANFLAGGEFPIPVAQTSSTSPNGLATLTVEFKQFGVALAFTPTILKDGLINLVVNPEVSSIDPANSVSSGGVTIPGLSVRRAHTTIELRDGESFTIAGLLKQNYASQIRQLPFLGDLPILGSLFRSTAFQRDETELVIVVTPHLATPRRGGIALPGDQFVPPSDFELFLFGSQNGSAAMLRPEDRALLSTDPRKGGVEGPHGHVLY